MSPELLLDPDIAHLNHGSYGATPLAVLEEQWEWQRRMERRTVEFHARRLEGHLREARAPLAAFLGAELDNTAFVSNATTAINWVAHALPLGPGDEVLLNDHEYGAVVRTWQVFARERGFTLKHARVPLGGDLLSCLERERSDRTRAVVVSHITSPTAQLFPVADVCDWARRHQLWSVVDGAHVPGHVPVTLEALGADFWVGNLHKWLWAPKGSALFYVAPSVQSLIRPLVTSWGVDSPEPLGEPGWVAMVQMQATRDPSPFLASPAGLDYYRGKVQALEAEACWQRLERLSVELERRGAVPLPWTRPLKMRAFQWPHEADATALRRWFFEERQVEMPIYRWEDRLLFRVSLQPYVSDPEIARMLDGWSALPPALR